MNHVAKFNASTSALDRIAEQEALEQLKIGYGTPLHFKIEVSGDVPHYQIIIEPTESQQRPVMLCGNNSPYRPTQRKTWIHGQCLFKLNNEPADAIVQALQSFTKIDHCSNDEVIKRWQFLMVDKCSPDVMYVGVENQMVSINNRFLTRRINDYIKLALAERPKMEASTPKPRRRSKYTLDQLLAKCDVTAPMPEEFKDWDNMESVGLERGEGI